MTRIMSRGIALSSSICLTGTIPNTMKDITLRPPESWWNDAVTKAIDFEDYPQKYSMDLWYNLIKSDDIEKAVAEPLDSKNQPKKRGENDEMSDGGKVSVADLTGPGKSEKEVTY